MTDPLEIFRDALATSIRDIETDPRGKLFQRFLRDGPYEIDGPIPPELFDKRLSDADTSAAISFVYAHMVNCFQGRLAELLACAPCLRLVDRLKLQGRLPGAARLYVGDAVGVRSAGSPRSLKGADSHVLACDQPGPLHLHGVVEVKSYAASTSRLRGQLLHHITRASGGLVVEDPGVERGTTQAVIPRATAVLKIGVVPATWKLSRRFWFEKNEHGRLLRIEESLPPEFDTDPVSVEPDEWRIVLRWSKESLAAAAYNMTFWYMEKVGEVIYSEGLPENWSGMDAADAGRNAVKMMLYYAIPRCRTDREGGRAIALYNAYGFGYALGMNFRDRHGSREMLWPEDLDEILADGTTKHGCRIVGL